MTLLKTRPDIEVRVPTRITPGARLEVEVRLHARQDVEVEHVHVGLACVAGWAVGVGNHRVTRRDDLLRLHARLFGGPKLARGDHVLPVAFDLAPELPPSHERGAVSVRWSLDVEVSLPWWPDARSHHPLTVVLPDIRAHEAAPGTFRQNAPDWDPAAPRIEGSLASRTVAPGGRIAGAVALYNFDQARALSVHLGIVERNALFAHRGAERLRQGRRWSLGTVSSAGPHERGTPFELALPEDLNPSFRCPAFAHGYTLEIDVETGLLARSTLSVPILVANDGALRNASAHLAIPAVGLSRMAEIGREVASRRGYAVDGASLTRSVELGAAPMGIEISHESHPGEGLLLVGKITFPRLGLGLAVEPRKGLAARFARSIEIGDSTWDRAHHVSARDPRQAAVFLDALVERLEGDDTFREIRDDHAIVACPDPAMSAESLGDFTTRIERVALAVGEALALVPPPTGVDPTSGWPALAERLGGRFVVGALAIDDGRAGAAEVHVDTWWEHGPVHRIEVVPDPPIPDEVALGLDVPRRDARARSGLGAEGSALLEGLPQDAAHLRIEHGKIRVELPLSRSAEALRARPDDVSIVVEQLVRLAPLLTLGRQGPFR